MEWSIIITLIAFGLLLIVAEIIFVPGTTVVGFLGFGILLVGIFLSFRYYGSDAGWITLGLSSVAAGLVFYFSFRTNVWKKFALKSAIKSKVNENAFEGLAPGQEGIALSALRPAGKGEVANRVFEVRTNGEYVDRGTRFRIIKIALNQIIVEPTP